MNELQKEKYNKYEHEIKQEIADLENHAIALALIEYNPKADGSERVNFDDNFAIHGLGTKGAYKPGVYYRRVKVRPVTYNGYWEGKPQDRILAFDISVEGISNEADMKAAGLEHPVKDVNAYRFALSFYTKRPSMPVDAKPEEIVKVIRDEIVPGIKERIKKLWGELGQLPQIFRKVVEAANACNDVKKACEDTISLKYTVSHMLEDISKLHD